MVKKPYYLSNNDDSFNIKKELGKYLRNWIWFIISISLFFCFAFFYLKYTSVTYKTSGKIKILDESSKALELPGDISSLFESSKVNLENEIEVIKSHRLLERVVKNLDLNIVYIEEGSIKSKETWTPPFKVFEIANQKRSNTQTYYIEITSKGYHITTSKTKIWNIEKYSIDTPYENLPFLIIPTAFPNEINKHIGKLYKITFYPISKATAQLSTKLKISQVGKNSDILSLSIISNCNPKSEAIIDEVIRQFNLDGILDRQLVSQRTIDFVDARFVYLTKELDSIEDSKKGFKQKNNLSDIRLDTEYTIIQKTNTTNEVSSLETQLEISKILKESLISNEDFTLLPTNIGLENASLNSLINDFNKDAIYYKKITEAAGAKNPITLNIEGKLIGLKANILNSLVTHETQTNTSLKRAKNINQNTNGLFSDIPKKAQILRAIERQQKIKETLYVLLLEKREEAAINLAVTSPSIKIVDHAITNPLPISPRKSNVYFISLSLGFAIPFVLLYLYFFTDSKIRTKDDLLKSNEITPIVTELPYSKKNYLIKNRSDRSVLSESFKVLRTNINHYFKEEIIDKKNSGKVIYVTSTIKGEGKTFTSTNLALSYLNLNKSVILVGADFRNPQIHSYFDAHKKHKGLSDYLNDSKISLEDLILEYKFDTNLYLKVLLSGEIPPNPDELLSNDYFEKVLNDLRLKFDYIIVDTAPTIPVTDTLLIAPYADFTLYVIRSGFTNKRLLPYIEELKTSEKLTKVCYVLNGLIPNKLHGYNYNYGYNYGYDDSPSKKSWLSKLFS